MKEKKEEKIKNCNVTKIKEHKINLKIKSKKFHKVVSLIGYKPINNVSFRIYSEDNN